MTASSLLQSYSLDVSEPWMVLRLEGVIPTGSVQLVVPWHELENARSPSQVSLCRFCSVCGECMQPPLLELG